VAAQLTGIHRWGADPSPSWACRGRVYDIKADSYSCRHAWDRYAAAPPGLPAGGGWRRSPCHCAMDRGRRCNQVKLLLTV